MNAEQASAWTQDAQETLAKLDMDKHNKENYLLLGATMAILGRGMLMDGNDHFVNVNKMADVPTVREQRIVEVNKSSDTPSFQSGNQRIDELLQTISVNFREYAEAKSDCVARPTTQNESVCNEDLADVLQSLHQIFLILRQSANTPEEKEQLREFHQAFHQR